MPRKDPEARRAYQKEYAQKNREAAYARVKEWRAANPDGRKEEGRRRRERYPEQEKERMLRWREANPERYAALTRKYRLNNKGRVIANKALYRSTKKERAPIWMNIGQRFEIRCVYTYCAALRSLGLQYEVDHIVPLNGSTVSGLHVPWNLQVIPAELNRKKNNGWA